MLKFIKHHMTSIDGIEIYPVVSLLIFFLFFVGLLWYTAKMDKVHLAEMEQSPLEESANNRKPLES